MARLLLGTVVVLIAFTIYSFVDCALTERRRVRGMPKVLWLLVTLVLPAIGGVLWFLIGRGPVVATRRLRMRAPDDDPDFLTGLRRTSTPGPRSKRPRRKRPSPVDEAEAIRRLEEELASRDGDADDDGDGGRSRP